MVYEFIVSLPWYDLEEIRPATNAFWEHLSKNMMREKLTNLPQHLNRKIAYEKQWKSRKFLFGQACGYDLIVAYANRLQLVATPRYSVPGCKQNSYSSFVIVHQDSSHTQIEDLENKRCVINTITSHSGMNILKTLVAPLKRKEKFFSTVKISGAHEKSIEMVVNKKVDVAAIDCVTYAILKQYRPHILSATRVLCQTQHVTAPPYVTGITTSPESIKKMQRALRKTLDDPTMSSIKAQLFLDNVDFLGLEAYQNIAELAKFPTQNFSNKTCLQF